MTNKKFLPKFQLILLVVTILGFQNCTNLKTPEFLKATRLFGEGGKIYDGKLAVTNIPVGASVSGYQVISGRCLDNFAISVNYQTGVNGPTSVTCNSGIFVFTVNILGTTGARSISLSQVDAQGKTINLEFSVAYKSTQVDYGSGFEGEVRASIADPVTKKIYVGGLMTSYRGTKVNGLARLNLDGSLDTSFDQGKGLGGRVYGLAYDPVTGGVYVTGMIYSYNEIICNNVLRIKTDGQYDFSFNSGVGFNGDTYGITLDPVTNKIYVVGWFTSYKGTAAKRIARLNTDGSIDKSFDSSVGLDGGVFSVALDSTIQKIYVAGVFNAFQSVPNYKFARLNTDGSLDTSFRNGGLGGSGFGGTSIVIDSTGLVYVAGEFQLYGGTPMKNLVRIKSNGDIDSSFKIGSGLNGIPWTMHLDSSKNQIYVGGSFTGYNDNTAGRIVRIHYDGSIDDAFIPGPGFNDIVYSIVLNESQTGFSVFGAFSQYNQTALYGFTRLLFDGSLAPY